MAISEQLRQAIDRDGRTRYAIAQASGVQMATLHRFYYGQGNLSASGIDKLAEALGLELAPKRRPGRKRSKGR